MSRSAVMSLEMPKPQGRTRLRLHARRNPLGAVSALLILGIGQVALGADLLAPFDAKETVLAINFLGDALRDIWDPKLRGSQ